VNRIDFQRLAAIRLDEAQVLIREGMFSGAYYLAGYSVECALKACIAKTVAAHDFPDKRFANDCWTHEIDKLVALTGLKQQRELDASQDAVLLANWLRVKDWNENSRYQEIDEVTARSVVDAVADQQHGVLQWIMQHW
jgi:hypothetical protein